MLQIFYLPRDIDSNLMRTCVLASVVDEPLWPVELSNGDLTQHPIYKVPIVVIAGRILSLTDIYFTVFTF